uniref:Membrane insertase YidC/Oxa/ALB C-terminal domain-containing protein n=1 Tax=Araucaria cunninghamii TaxID=56994 RepID=A0A0D6R582_ARACU
MASRRLLANLSGGASYTRAQWSSISPAFSCNALRETQSRSHRGSSGGFNDDLNPDASTPVVGFCGKHDNQDSDKSEKTLWSPLGFKSRASSFGTGFATSSCVMGGGISGLSAIGRVRYASSTSAMGEGSDKIDGVPGYIADVAGVLGEDSIDIVNKTQAVSEVAAAAANSSFPSATLQYFIEAVHIHSGLPWWASIAAATLFFRSVTVPILISQLKATTRLTLMRPRLEEISERMKQTTDHQKIEEGRLQLKSLFKEYNVTPLTPLKGLLIQGPIFMSFYFAISNMAENVPSFKQGGALWFLDLSTPDSLYLLPALTALSFLATVELNMQEGLEGNPMAGKMKMFSRFFALITVPVTMNFPKAIFCYWITSNLFSLVYGAVIRQPGVKKALGIPKIPVPPTPAETFVGSSASIEKGPPSSSLVHQRLRALERTVKAKRRGKKR